MQHHLYNCLACMVVIAIALAPRSDAQTGAWDEFYPLEEGSVYEYAAAHYSDHVFRRLTVLHDTSIVGETYTLVAVLERDMELEVTGESLCATRYDGDQGDIEWLSVSGDCVPFGDSVWYEDSDIREGEIVEEVVSVGGETFQAETLSIRSRHAFGRSKYVFARNVGLISQSTDYGDGGAQPFMRLVHAEVNAGSYGMPPEEHDWETFMPLSLGDEWVHSNSAGSIWENEDSIVHSQIVGDTVIAGQAYRVLAETHFDLETGDLVASGEYAVRLSNGRLELSGLSPIESEEVSSIWTWIKAHMLNLGLYNYLAPETPVEIADQSYVMDALARYSSVEGTIGNSVEAQVIARHVGLVRLEWQSQNGTGSSGYGREVQLIAADVGGERYGASSYLSNEGTEGALQMVVYPNPAHSFAVVGWAADEAGRSRLDVYDVLGRWVFSHNVDTSSGSSLEHRFDVEDLPAGVYIARVSDASGRSASKQFVKVK